MKSGLASAWLLFLAAAANAQFVRVQDFTLDAPGKKTPVIADIIVQTTSITPWGTYTEILKGKYWRSRDGKNRQDDSYGTSYLASPKAETRIDHELQTALVAPSALTELFVPLFSWSRVHVSLGQGTLMGRAVQGWGVPSRPNDFDIWTDTRLGIPLQIRTKGSTFEIVQQLNNIEEREPDPELFKIPEGFSVLKCTQTASGRQQQTAISPFSCSAGR